jgi:hypothetical protein
MANQKTADPEVDLEQHTVAELKEMAAEKDIEIPSHATKDEIIEAIESYNEEHPTEPIGGGKMSPMSAGVGVDPLALGPQYKPAMSAAQLAGLAPVVPAAVINPGPDRVADAYGQGSEFVVGLAQFAQPPAGGQFLLGYMPPGSIVQLVRVKHSQAVAGAGACTAQVSDGNGNTYGAALDVTTAPSDTGMVTVQPVTGNLGFFSQPTALYLTLSSTTLSAATAGSVSAWVRYVPLA